MSTHEKLEDLLDEIDRGMEKLNATTIEKKAADGRIYAHDATEQLDARKKIMDDCLRDSNVHAELMSLIDDEYELESLIQQEEELKQEFDAVVKSCTVLEKKIEKDNWKNKFSDTEREYEEMENEKKLLEKELEELNKTVEATNELDIEALGLGIYRGLGVQTMMKKDGTITGVQLTSDDQSRVYTYPMKGYSAQYLTKYVWKSISPPE
ncbi:hypothetical protein PHYBLDRAFT_71816 [Phycomyces blakesleeanus NRRL 1555(-)]|uniref:Kinetochore protein Spc24 n=1 Tax=Phycomyces blakesleeanus (strain ATCC 8743b / DSM 1359 / FGSC 10004 / NBRC 33097 / NRRL 1555) TaxID=763407 RepID=A0A162PKC6_PHYB8|nr:hypothetical protein PHYBLDRAFT_71816 [Phycomyces blakesleeanus NRRL 1555(-)]OAD73637.1 hypothetical protein PHYBLDRAFT_71816 [Phycomyces blakesleeanus NRRL 1555(-)]|eukprot:XP_018291677.1 hypothetical protein PHYBLDRAFT_71816 [Phycomyces blakesleeanus NRRL 1555(-)]